MNIAFTITLDCRDDLPLDVVAWMARNLREYAEQEFRHAMEQEVGDDDESEFATVVAVTALRG